MLAKMNKLLDYTLMFFWIAGVVLAKGFWWTVLAIFFPFYAWYLVVEKTLFILGFL